MPLLTRLGSLSAINFAAPYTRKAAEQMYLAVGINQAPYVDCYKVSAAGFGVKIASPSISGTGNMYAGYGANFSPTNTDFVTTTGNSPILFCFPFSASGFGTKYANPATLPANNNSNGGAWFSKTGTTIISGTGNSKWDAYRFTSGVGFGTKYADPVTKPGGDVTGVAFNPTNTVVASSHPFSPYVSVYPWTEGTGFGTKYANPSPSPNGDGTDVEFSNAGGTLFITANNYGLKAYRFSNGFQSQYSGSGIGGPKPGGICINSTDTAVFSTSKTSGYTPYVGANRWIENTGFGTAYSASALYSVATPAIAISSDDSIIASFANTGYVGLSGFNASTGYTGTLTNPSPQPNISIRAIAFTNKLI